ncbi:MAG: hypothetical protein EA399_06640 [Desulfovibrionales bacterium]|nr:MAG: hypothetical protein EA399_06640 [Desulfovibrionales bacterium]
MTNKNAHPFRAYNHPSILAYAEAIGWTFVSREEAEQRRGFDPTVPPADRAKNRSLFFDDLLDAKVREFNPRYAEAEDGYRFCDILSPECDKKRLLATNKKLDMSLSLI